MVNRSDDIVNFDKLDKELNAAVAYDERYWRENDAKFRAIHQKVATYEEFRDIVAAAHLKPLEKTDKIDGSFKQKWNSSATSIDGGCSGKLPNTSCLTQQSQQRPMPKTMQEFVNLWKRTYQRTEDRYSFLVQLDSDCVEQIFQQEIGFGLLGDILTVLNTAYQELDAEVILTVLRDMTRAYRFQLSLDFLNNAERDACKQLMTKLEDAQKLPDSEFKSILTDLRKSYCIEC